MYQVEEIKKALQIKKALLEGKGVIDIKKSPELYEYYMDENVEEVLIIMMEELRLNIKQVENNIYLIPEIGNEIYGMSNEQYKSLYGNKSLDREGLYLSYFILMVILSKIYAGKGNDPKLLTHISVQNVIEEIDNIFLEIYDDDNNVEEIEYGYEINIRATQKRWESLSIRNVDKDKPRAGKTKYAAIIRSVDVFMKQGLLRYLDEEEIIKPERKLDDLMRNYYLGYERKDIIDSLLSHYMKEEDYGKNK